jgi:hypothetical protein
LALNPITDDFDFFGCDNSPTNEEEYEELEGPVLMVRESNVKIAAIEKKAQIIRIIDILLRRIRNDDKPKIDDIFYIFIFIYQKIFSKFFLSTKINK